MDSISAKEFASISLPDNVIILDVRTQEEWNEGHIAVARHIDYFSEDFEEEIQKLPKNAVYYVYCKAGQRSAGAIYYMQKKGIEKCINIADGILGIAKTNIPLVI